MCKYVNILLILYSICINVDMCVCGNVQVYSMYVCIYLHVYAAYTVCAHTYRYVCIYVCFFFFPAQVFVLRSCFCVNRRV